MVRAKKSIAAVTRTIKTMNRQIAKCESCQGEEGRPHGPLERNNGGEVADSTGEEVDRTAIDNPYGS